MNELKENENNSKKFWKVIREVIPSDKTVGNNDIFLKDKGTELRHEEVAHFINDYFINVCNVSTPAPDAPLLTGDHLANWDRSGLWSVSKL